MRSIKITNGIILKQKHIMQEQKKPVGRPKADDPKKEHIRIRVTTQEKKMLKGIKMSSEIKRGLNIIIPSLGFYNADDNTWLPFQHKGESELRLVHSAMNVAINTVNSAKEPATPQLMLMALLMRQKNELENFLAANY